MRIAIAFALLVAGAAGAAAQMWNEDMSNGARSNLNNQYVQPRATPSGTYGQGYQAITPGPARRDKNGTRGNVNPYAGAIGTPGARY
jgi:hypothetical protein